MLSSKGFAASRRGLTLIEVLIAIAVFLGVLTVIIIIVNHKNPLVAASEKLAAERCKTATSDSGAVRRSESDLPPDNAKALSADLSGTLTYQMMWRKKQVGDKVVCEYMYCVTGRRDNKTATNCSQWIPVG